MNEACYDFDLYNIPEPKKVMDTDVKLPTNLIVVYKEDYATGKELFDKIFHAVGLSDSADLYVLQLTKGEQVRLSEILDADTKQVITFGISPAKLGINATFIPYKPYQTETYNILLSHSLNKLSEKQDYKKALWMALKKMYVS